MFKLKQHIINYARNCHNDSLIVLKDDKHDRYMSFLNKLEAICDREISEDLTHDQMWKQILEMINSLNDEQLTSLEQTKRK